MPKRVIKRSSNVVKRTSSQTTNPKDKSKSLPKKNPANFMHNIARPITKTFRHQFDQILADNKSHKKNMQKIITKTILFFLTLMMIIVAGGAISIYHYHSESKFIQNLSKIIPYPVAKIGNSKNPTKGLITYQEFLLELNSNISINDQLKKSEVDSNRILNNEQLHKIALQAIVDREIIAQESKKLDLNVTNSEIEAELNEAINQAGGKENFTNSIDILYKKDINQIKKEIEIGLLKLKLEEKIVLDDKLNKDQVSLINSIYQRLSKGENFNDLAKTYSQDAGSASNGGDIGIITKSQIANDNSQKTFAEALFATPVGQYSKIVETTKYGYHIIKVEEKISDDQVKARQILIKHLSFEDWYNNTNNNFAKKYFINY